MDTLLDPNGQAHQVGDIYCSGCDYHPPNPNCVKCGALNHYWYIDDSVKEKTTLIGFECESCGGLKELQATNDEWV
jgi:hypothetical protein